MSDTTRSTMEDAIRAHFKDTAHGAYMTDYYLIATGPAATTGERAHAYIYEDGESPYHITKGLVAMSMDYITAAGEDDEDD